MSDLIDRQAAIDAVKDLLDSMLETDTIGFYEIEHALFEVPSAQPERKKGKWIDETFEPWGLVHHPYKCDQCGEHSEADSNYCPSCGAKMEV